MIHRLQGNSSAHLALFIEALHLPSFFHDKINFTRQHVCVLYYTFHDQLSDAAKLGRIFDGLYFHEYCILLEP